jgi:hypothetical protein
MTERLNISESEYRGLPMPSYSLLKRIDESGPRALKYSKKYDSEAIDFGSLLDCKLITAHEFDNKFYFDATEKPTAQLLELADYICANWDITQSISIDSILDLSAELNLFGGTKDPEKRIAKFDNDLFWNYLEAKEDALGKTVFTPDTLAECCEAEIIIKTHPNTAWIFNPSKDIEVLTQVMLVAEINGIEVKIMADIIILDHLNKTVTPYDLKATEMHMPAFKHHFVKMEYYLQGSLYKEAVSNWMRDELQLGYALEDFKFIVYSRSDKFPFIWNMGSEWHKKGLYGFENVFGEKEKGVYELLDDYMFYSQNPEVEVNRKFIENKILEL